MRTLHTSSKRNVLIFILWILSLTLVHGQIVVSNTDDTGAGSLRQAILDAEANSGADVIDLTGITGTITLASGLPNITQDLTINGAGNTATIIDGNGQYRPFFIGGAGVSDTDAPIVILNNLAIQNGLAKGIDPTGAAGGGAGMGGAMFINDGTVTLNNIIFDGNQANGGNGGSDQFGGGGKGGDGPFASSGGDAATLNHFQGGNGQFGAGGGGGIYNFNFGGADGGNGGYGAGGGGGGGHSSAYGIGGQGGSFGGKGANAVDLATAGGGGGAGLGGAIYLRNGTIDLNNSTFSNNSTSGGLGGVVSGVPTGGNGQAKGGAIFNAFGGVYNQNSTFSNNSAANAGSSSSDNVDNYGQFQTNDSSGPALTFHPLDQAAEVVSNTGITITLDKTGYVSGLPIVNADLAALISLNQGTVDGLVVAITATISNNIITIVPATELNIAETYFLSIGIVEDYFGNVTTAQSVSFSTTSNQPPTFTISHTALTLLEGITTTQQYPAFVTNIDDGDPTLTQNTTLSLEILSGAELFLTQPQFGTNNLIYFRAVGGNVTGAAVVSVTVTDDGPGQASTTKTFTITIEEINDSPEIEGETNFSFGEDVPSQVILPNHFSISSGGNDPNQNITITIDKTNLNEVFTDIVLALDGTITIDVDASKFKYHDNNGNVSAGITIQDDGGTENNGNDTYTTTFYFSLTNTIDSPPFFGATVSGSTTITEFGSLNYRFSVRDEDSENFEITNIQKPSWINLQAYGWNTYTDPVLNQDFAQPEYRLYGGPGADEFVGTNTFSFEINGTEISVNIEVTDEDSPPTGTPVTSMTVDEGPGEQRVLLIENLSDGDAHMEQTLILDYLQYYMTGVSNATIFKTLPTLDLSTGELVFELMPDFNGGPILFTFQIFDDPVDADEGENYIYGGSIPLTVNPTEDFPEFIYSLTSTIDEGDNYHFPFDYRDGDGDEVTIDFISLPSWINTNGGSIGKTKAVQSGTRSFGMATSPKDGLVYYGSTVFPYYINRVNADGTMTNFTGGGDDRESEGIDASNAFTYIYGLNFNSEGVLYFSSFNKTIRKINPDGTVSSVVGTYNQSSSSYQTGDVSTVLISAPRTIDFDSQDNLYFYDNTYNKLSKLSNGMITEVNYSGGSDFQIINDQIWSYESKSIKKYGLDGTLIETIELTLTSNIGAIRVIDDKEILVSTGPGIYRYFVETGYLQLLTSGVNGSAGDGNTLSNTQFRYVRRMAVQDNREVILYDDTDQKIRKFENVPNTALAGIPTEAEVGDHFVSLKITDSKGNETIISETVTVINVQNPPTNVQINPEKIDETIQIGESVTLKAVDTDLNETYTFTLVAGEGDTDNGTFQINGDQLVVQQTFHYETKSEYRIRVKVEDSGGLMSEIQATIEINNVIFDPTDIQISIDNIDENSAENAKIADLTATDEDANDIHTFTLVAGTGDTDNASFSITGLELIATESFNFELKSSYSIRLKVEDAANGTIEKQFTITINDVIDPIDLQIQDVTANEDEAFSMEVLAVSEDNLTINYSHQLPSWASLVENPGGYFIQGTPTNADVGNNAVEITASASGTPDVIKTINIEVLNTNDAPTGLTIDNNTINEYLLSGAPIGTLFTLDQDPGDTFTYALVTGTGDTDNGSFAIDANKLVSGEIFNYDTKSSYSVRVESTDSGGEKVEEQFGITIYDVSDTPPQFTSTPVTTATEGSEYEYTIEAVDLLDESITLSDITLPEWLNFINQPEGYVDLIVNEGIIQFQIGADGFYYVNAGDNILKASLDGSTFENLLPAASLTSVQDFVVTADNDIIVNDNNVFKKISNGAVTTIGTLFFDYWDYHPSGHIVYITNSGTELKKMDMNGSISDIGFGIFNIGYGMEVSPSGNIIFEGSTTGHDRLIDVLDITGQGTTFNLTSTFSSNGSEGIYTLDNFTYDRAEENLYVQYTFADGTGALHPYNLLKRDASGNEIVIWDAINDGLPTANTPKYGLGYYSIDENNKLVISLIDYTGNTQDSPIKRYEEENNKLVGTPTTADVGTNTVTIRASDAATDVDQTFDIEVDYVNDNPTDISLSVSSVDENQAAITLVGQLTSTDTDAVHGDTHTYALVAGTGDDDNASFTITNNQLSTASTFDKETKGSFSILVESTDAKGGKIEKTFTITVNNVNEAPTHFTTNASSIAENLPVGSKVTDITVADPDATNTHVLELPDQDDNAHFTVSNGELLTATSFDFETKSSYMVTILVKDGPDENATDYHTIQQTITINVNDANDAPTTTVLNGATVNENDAIGIGAGIFSTDDQDNGDSFIYTLVSGTGSDDNASFTINNDVLETAESYDFETKSSYSIRVKTDDQNGGTIEEQFTVTIIDSDDVITTIELSANTQDENTVSGTFIGTFSASYINSVANVTYSLVTGFGDNADFTISGNELKNNVAFDFETKSSYSIKVKADDGLYSIVEKEFTIVIGDLDDVLNDINLSSNTQNENTNIGTLIGTLSASYLNSAANVTFSLVSGFGDNANFILSGNELKNNVAFDFETKSSYSIKVKADDGLHSIVEKEFTIVIGDLDDVLNDINLSSNTQNENTNIGTLIGTLSASYLNSAANVTFSLVSGFGDNADFTISGNELKNNVAFDFENKSSYFIKVKADDGVGSTIEKVLTIVIVDQSESPSDIALSNTSVNENGSIGEVVGTLSAADPDGTGSAIFSLIQGFGDNNHFEIVGNELKTVVVFDFEQKSNYALKIQVDDGSGNTYSEELVITIVDKNDAPTAISLSANIIDENVAANTVIGSLSTTDADVADSHTYTLVSGFGDNTSFGITDANLTNASAFDFETKSSYSIKVKSDDGNGGSFEQEFTISVKDANDAPTAISVSANNIDENAASNTTIGSFSTTDVDANSTHSYTLVSGFGDYESFSISGANLTNASAFDFETKSSYSIKVKSDDGNGGAFEQEFTITVNDINEAPTAISLSANSLDENVVSGTIIGAFTTSDVDANSTHTYTLVSGFGDNASFGISGTNLTNASVFDFETKSSYSIKIKSDDGKGGTFEQEFTISVKDANDAPTAISLSENNINEDAVVGSVIGTLSTTDDDATDTHTYEVLTSFTLDGVTGFPIIANGDKLVTTVPLDFETFPSFTIDVKTTDANGLSFTGQFTLLANDVNDAPTAMAISSNTIDENLSIGSKIGDLSTTDQDAGDTHTYTLVSGIGDNDLFSISGSELASGQVFDFETKSSYSIKVNTDDGNGGTFEQEFSIIVNDANDAPTAISLSASSIDENVVAGTVIGALSTTDVDAINTHTYTLVSGFGDNANFTISGTNLTNAQALDFETKSSHGIKVKTDDGMGGTFEQEFTITVNDINEGGAQTITFGSLPNKTFGDDPFQLNATANSGLTVSYSSSNLAVATISGSTVTIVSSGETIITASQPGNMDFEAALDVTQKLVIEKASQTITFDEIPDQVSGADPITLSATASSGLGVSYSATGPVTISGSTLTITGVGQVIVTATQGGNNNYHAANTTRAFVVTDPAKTDQVITFNAPAFVLVNETTVILEASSDSGLDIEFEIVSGNQFATLSGDNLHPSAIGTIEVAAKQVGNATFNPATEVATIEIRPVFAVSGSITDEKGDPFTNGGVVLISVDTQEGPYVLLDASGNFSASIPEGIHYLVAIPNDTDTYYHTFLGNVIFWQDATVLNLNADVTGQDVQMVPKPSEDLLTGNGTVKGKVQNSGSSNGRVEMGRILEGEGLEGVSVFLIRLSDDVIMTDVVTDANGEFEINGIPEGSYRLQVEIAGVEMDLGSAGINIDAEGTPVELTALVGEDGIVIEEVITSLDEVFTNSVKVYPNPFDHQLKFQIDNELLGNIDIQILTIDGRVLFANQFDKNSLKYHFQLDNVNFPDGIVILRLVHEDAVATFKLLKH